MFSSNTVIYSFELIGTIAFASSGALVGIRKNMDIFGINVLGITTAVGGGCIRDIILGINPPKMFQNFSYVIAAITTSRLEKVVANTMSNIPIKISIIDFSSFNKTKEQK